MRKNLLSKKLMLILIATTLFSFIKVQAQVKEVVIYTSADVTLGSGTGQAIGDLKSSNIGADGNLQMCNFDDNENLMSYFEGWMKFDLTSLPDSIPAGHGILFAEIKFRVSANAGPQGFKAYHLYNADDWQEGNGKWNQAATVEGLTWDAAQAYDYENENKYAFITSDENPGGTSARPTFNVTQPVLYELGEQGNKILTIRLKPFIDEYDASIPEKQKKWLGFYARESTYDMPEGAEFNPYCAQITFWIGPEQPTNFSNMGEFGKLGNYFTYPDKYGSWMVAEDEGETRLKLASRPAPINGTPGGLAVYNKASYTDFDLSVQAKSASFNETNKADFAVIFGYQDPSNYSYVYLIGDDEGGLYNVTDGEGTLVSAQATPAISDTLYHDYNVIRIGNKVTVSIDGTEYMTFEDGSLGTEGKIGVSSYNDVATFDNFFEISTIIANVEAKIDTVEAGTEIGQYPQEAITAFQDAIDSTKTVLETSGITQAEKIEIAEYLFAAEKTFDGQIHSSTGIGEYKNHTFKMYPNPSNGRLTIESEDDIKSITIVNILGQTILSKDNILTRKMYIDLSDVKTGIYFVTCYQVNGGKSISRLIKK